jgi:hypothetical protein
LFYIFIFLALSASPPLLGPWCNDVKQYNATLPPGYGDLNLTCSPRTIYARVYTGFNNDEWIAAGNKFKTKKQQ